MRVKAMERTLVAVVLMDFFQKGNQMRSPVMGSNFRATVWGVSQVPSAAGALSRVCQSRLALSVFEGFQAIV